MRRATLTAALVATGVALFSGCGASGKDVSRSQFESDGKVWPLTVDSGKLACESGGQVTFTADGTTYAANGTAKGSGKWDDITSIWADNPDAAGLKSDISDLIDAGRALC